jgi:hypothetical protein
LRPVCPSFLSELLSAEFVFILLDSLCTEQGDIHKRDRSKAGSSNGPHDVRMCLQTFQNKFWRDDVFLRSRRLSYRHKRCPACPRQPSHASEVTRTHLHSRRNRNNRICSRSRAAEVAEEADAAEQQSDSSKAISLPCSKAIFAEEDQKQQSGSSSSRSSRETERATER